MTQAQSFRILEMDCAEEVAVLKREVAPLVGGEDNLGFDVLRGKMTVASGAQPIAAERIIQAIARTGMRGEVWQEDQAPADAPFWQSHGRLILTVISGVLTLAGFAVHALIAGNLLSAVGHEGIMPGHAVPLPAAILFGLGVMSGIYYVLPKAWLAARRLRPDMNLLMTVAVAGAIFLGEWFEAAMISFLFALSLQLESWSIGRARRAVESLYESAPTTVRVRGDDGSERDLSPEEVAVGSVFVVYPGEKIPLDGRVLEGMSGVDQAPITGESVPVSKQAGDEVFAGTINGDGMLAIESTQPADQTTLANIIRLVTEAQSRRAPSEQWVEKFARIYTPAVMALAVAVCVIPPVVLGAEWGEWFYRSLVLLVIACPCALVISTPVSIIAALTSAARNGVLIKGGVYLEAPAHLKAIAMDKTGTLTEGRAKVVQLIPLGGHDEVELIKRAAALESRSNHPLARAIVAEAKRRNVAVEPAQDLVLAPGKGASGRFNGKSYWIGSHRFLEERGQDTPEVHRQLLEMSDAGHTAVIVGAETHVCGIISLADAVRPQARQAIEALRSAGVHNIVMLTGDNLPTAEAIAREVGITEVQAGLLPQDKVAAVEALVQRYGQVAMVGDGINDAPAMARATLSIAMGAAGSDAAIETADIALMSDDLTKLPWLIRHARRTLGIIRQNIGLALAVKAIFVALTLAGHASLWAAIAADMGASLVVIFNGLRLLRVTSNWRGAAEGSAEKKYG